MQQEHGSAIYAPLLQNDSIRSSSVTKMTSDNHNTM